MKEQIVLGVIQGVAEWLPVSSEGLLVLVKVNLFGSGEGVESLVKEALFLHLGTFFAALIYFRKDVAALSKLLIPSVILNLLQNPDAKILNRVQDDTFPKTYILLKFFIIATFVSGGLGFLLLKLLGNFEADLAVTGKMVTLGIGFLLLGTAAVQIRAKGGGFKKTVDLERDDGLLLGLAQGLSVMPGLSRSGLTISALLLRKFDKTTALKLSFLMSLPIVLAGNILLNYKYFAIAPDALVGLLSSFIFGILTIHALLKLSRKINFGYFVFVFALLTIASVLV